MKFLIPLMSIIILSTSYAEDPIDALYTKDERITHSEKSGTTKELYPVEMCNVLKTFHRALAARDYDKALTLCSKEMVTESQKYDSAESFFKTLFAIDNLLTLKKSPMHGAWVWGAHGEKEPTSMLCSMMIEGFQWKWKINLVDGKWVISFGTEPFKGWLEANRIYKKKRDAVEKRRKASVAAKIPGIRTILTPLQTTFKLGQPMLFRLDLKHDGPGTLHFDHQQVKVNGSITVKDADGNSVEYAAGPYQTIGHFQPIEAGRVEVLFDTFDITTQYPIKKPGVYTVQFSGSGLSVGEQYKLEQFEKDYLKRMGYHAYWDTRVTGTLKSFPSNIVTITVTK